MLHGVGVETGIMPTIARKDMIKALDAFVIVLVGELNKNKNVQVVICAMAQSREQSVFYIVYGSG